MIICESHEECQPQQIHLYCDLVYKRCEPCHLLCRSSLSVDCRTNCQHFLDLREKEVTFPTSTLEPEADIIEDGTSSQSLAVSLCVALIALFFVIVASVITFTCLWCRNHRKTRLQTENIECQSAMNTHTNETLQSLIQGKHDGADSFIRNEEGHSVISETLNFKNPDCNEQRTTQEQKHRSQNDHTRRIQDSQNIQYQQENEGTSTLHQRGTSNEQRTEQRPKACKGKGLPQQQQQSTKPQRQNEMSQNDGRITEGSQCRQKTEAQTTDKVQRMTTKTKEYRVLKQKNDQNVDITNTKDGQQAEVATATENSQMMVGSREARKMNSLVKSDGKGTSTQTSSVDEGYGASPKSTPHSSGERHTSGNDSDVDRPSTDIINTQPEAPKHKVTKPAFVNRKFIYEYLRRAPWVDGYFSAGDSIEVYVDLTTITEAWALDELTKQTHQQRNLFHIKHTNEQY